MVHGWNRLEVVYSPEHEDWMLVLNGEHVEDYELKQEAERQGRERAKQEAPCEFVVRNMSDDVSYQQFYEQ